MKKIGRALAAVAAAGLVLAGCSDGEVKPAGAAATTTTTEPAVTPSGALGGYQPVSDVAQHARMSLDLCEINGLLDARPVDFAAVAAIYRQGKFSDEKEGVKRTLGGFATGSRQSEETLSGYERYLGAGWLNAFVGDAIEGVGAFDGASEAVRAAAVRIGVRDQIMVAWALHELDAAVDKASKGSFTKKSGAPHNWDEVWAYYHGEKPECSPFSTAQARGEEFGVGTLINRRIRLFMKEGLESLVDKSILGARQARAEVVRDFTITYLQSAIRSAAGIDAALVAGRADEARLRQAEGWAYYRVVEPLVAHANTTTARTLTGVFDLASAPAAGSVAKVTGALSGTYEALDISPADIGGLPGVLEGPQPEAAGEAEGPDEEGPDEEGPDEGGPEDGEPDDGE